MRPARPTSMAASRWARRRKARAKAGQAPHSRTGSSRRRLREIEVRAPAGRWAPVVSPTAKSVPGVESRAADRVPLDARGVRTLKLAPSAIYTDRRHAEREVSATG